MTPLHRQEPDVLEEIGEDFIRDMYEAEAAELRRQDAQYTLSPNSRPYGWKPSRAA